MPKKIGNVLSWGSDLEKETIEQAAKARRLPFVKGHLALMPDAHVGLGATIGSVIPTQGAIVPSAVGVDIGCGMIAAQTNLSADQLPDGFDRFLSHVERVVPAGVGKGHTSISLSALRGRAVEAPPYSGASVLSGKQVTKIADQFGSLGSATISWRSASTRVIGFGSCSIQAAGGSATNLPLSTSREPRD